MRMLLACLLGHLALAIAAPSPWWVPNLTLVGLVLSVGRAPDRWLRLSLVAGLFTMAWAVRFAGPIVAGTLVVGWLLRVVAERWDATDGRVQGFLVMGASVASTLGALWLEGRWSLPLIALAGAHVAVTTAAVPLIRWLRVIPSGRRA